MLSKSKPEKVVVRGRYSVRCPQCRNRWIEEAANRSSVGKRHRCPQAILTGRNVPICYQAEPVIHTQWEIAADQTCCNEQCIMACGPNCDCRCGGKCHGMQECVCGMATQGSIFNPFGLVANPAPHTIIGD